jgi:hypothetical protein
VGTLLYNDRAVDPTIIVPLSTLASQLSIATSTTIDSVSCLLDYCSTRLEASIKYFASDMQLKIHSDASYLSESKAKSRICGYFYLGNKTNSSKKPLSNGPLLCHTTVLKHVVSSMAEAEFGAMFVNAQEVTVTRTTLSEMGHKQDATEIKTDNTTTDGIINNTVQKKHSKAKDMILYWVKDRVEQDQLNVACAPGDTNIGDYFTKHHSPAHHKRMIPYYLHDKHYPMIRHNTRLAILRGCVDISPSSHPDWALSSLRYGPKLNCNLSQSHHGHMSIACAHTTGNSNTHLRQVSNINLCRYQYKQGCNLHSHTQVYKYLDVNQLYLNAPYKHLCVIVSTSPVGRTN